MEKYIITYIDLNVIQIKNLIDHSLHEEGKHIYHIIPKEADKLRKEYYSKFGIYFTNESPLFNAIQTGILEVNNQKFLVKITKFKL